MLGETAVETRRKLPRVPLIHHFRVNDLVTNEHVGYLGNLTVQGAMLFAEKPLAEGSERILPLSLIVPRMHGEQSVYLGSRCVWCRPDARTGLYAAGLQLQDIGEYTRRRIRSLFREFASKS